MGAVDMWYEEIKLYKAKPPKYSSDHATGHFSQLVWGETELVGCGYSYYKEPSGNMWDQLITCDYARAGNRKKHDLYKVGDPCSVPRRHQVQGRPLCINCLSDIEFIDQRPRRINYLHSAQWAPQSSCRCDVWLAITIMTIYSPPLFH